MSLGSRAERGLPDLGDLRGSTVGCRALPLVPGGTWQSSSSRPARCLGVKAALVVAPRPSRSDSDLALAALLVRQPMAAHVEDERIRVSGTLDGLPSWHSQASSLGFCDGRARRRHHGRLLAVTTTTCCVTSKPNVNVTSRHSPSFVTACSNSSGETPPTSTCPVLSSPIEPYQPQVRDRLFPDLKLRPVQNLAASADH